MYVHPFSGTAYLSLDRHPAYLAFIHEGLDGYGAHYGGSRHSALAPDVYAKAEAQMTLYTGAPTALLVSSGSTAGQLLTRLPDLQDAEFHYAPWTHPALWRAGGKKYRSSAGWIKGVQTALAQGRKVVALADTVSPLYALQLPWEWLREIPPSAPLTVITDDSHGLGVAGAAGSGAWAGLRERWQGRLLVSASTSKAFSMPGGLILGSPDDVASLQTLPQFGSASPPPPAHVYAWLQAAEQGLLHTQHQRLQHNISLFQSLLAEIDYFYFLPHFPFFCTPRHELAAILQQEAGITISSFRYPGPHDPLVTRIIVTAAHEEAELRTLAQHLSRY